MSLQGPNENGRWGEEKKKHESSGGDKKKTRATVGFEWTDLAWLGFGVLLIVSTEWLATLLRSP